MSSFLGLAVSMALTVAAGVGLVLQQALNADLRVSLGSAAWAGFVSYIGGTLCMVVLILVMRDGVPGMAAIARTHWFSWTGGFFGAVFIALGIFLLQQLGAATFISLLIAGQMLGSVLFDHYGLFGLPQHPADATRLIGAGLLVAGVALIRL
jgi:bacterial/archaeal transporter family-2 protein